MLMRKKVMMVIPTLGGGGAERIVTDLVRFLPQNRWDIQVVSLYGRNFGNEYFISQIEKTEHAKVVFLEKQNGFDFSLIKKLRKIIKGYQPDVIHTHLYAGVYMIVASLFLDKRILHTVHNIAEQELPRVHRKIMKLSYQSHKLTPVAISKTVLESICKMYRLKEKDIKLIYNGIDRGQFIKGEIEETIYDFIVIGRLAPQKNPMLVLKAFSKTLELFPDAKLCICGDGQLRQTLLDLIGEYGLEKNVELTGYVTNVSDYLKKSAYFVFASDFEGFGLAMIEAMAAGLPVIASKTDVAVELMTEGNEGYFCLINDVESLSGVMKRCLSVKGSVIYNRLCKNAAKRALQFDIKNMVAAYEELYGELANG